ncbi:MAG: hypothetical protein ABSE95_18680 [Thermodesulfobacteriota bacterium]|jgi:hypothetical protein
MKVRFLKLADQELTDAVTWYDQQADGLGRDFLDELDRAIRDWLLSPCPVRE